MTRPVKGNITSTFSEPRPLSNPGDHVHGALDIAAAVGTQIYAPEGGELFAWMSFRNEEGQYWPDLPMVHNRLFTWCNYFYDMYGGLLILYVPGEKRVSRTHLFAHVYGNQIVNKAFYQENMHYQEEAAAKRFPIHAFYTDKVLVKEGDVIGYLGNAGYSTGPHIHWEIHPGSRYFPHADRIDPEKEI